MYNNNAFLQITTNNEKEGCGETKWIVGNRGIRLSLLICPL